MKKTIFTLSLLIAAMIFAACGDTDNEYNDGGGIIFNNEEVERKDAVHVEGGVINMFYEPKSLEVSFYSQSMGGEVLWFSLRTLNYDDEKNKTVPLWYYDSEKGKEYEKYYGDTTYSGLRQNSGPSYEVSAMPLNSISITADKDFDSEHPAGTLLNDIFVFEYASAYELIESKYDVKLNINLMPLWDAYQLIPLKEFKPIQLPYHNSSLFPTKLPETLGAYEFTIAFEYGKDPVSGREVQVPPVKVMAEFTDKDYVSLPKR